MAKNQITQKSLNDMEIVELRKLAREVGLKNYLRLSEDALRTAILAQVTETEEETEEVAEVDSNEEETTGEFETPLEEIEEEVEAMETGKHNVDFDPSMTPSEEAPAKPKKTEKKAEKKTAPKKESAGEESKSDKVRAIIRELIEGGRDFTSGKVMALLLDRHNLTIHRSFVISLISKERKKIEAGQ